MRRICFAISLCLVAWGSIAGGTPPSEQLTTEQLIKDQLDDDQQRQAFSELASQMRDPYESESLQRVILDQMARLDRARNLRASQYWELLGIALPLKTPLEGSKREQLVSLIDTFKGTRNGQLASDVLIEHQTLAVAAEAKSKLEKLQLGSISEELSEAQLTQLIEIEKEFSKTEAAELSKRYLREHFKRRIQGDLQLRSTNEELSEAQLTRLMEVVTPSTTNRPKVNSHYLEVELADTYVKAHFKRRARERLFQKLTPEMMEQSAGQRLTEVREQFRQNRSKSNLRKALAAIVEDYPNTVTSQQAKQQLVEVEKLLAAEVEHARSIREYWDAAYPSRIVKRNEIRQ